MAAFESPRIVIFAGPNGAGKTTFARELLAAESDRVTFINADLIAAGLSPFAPDSAAMRAGRIMLQAIEEHASQRKSFAFETTLAARNYVRWIPQWQESGYEVVLHFLSLPDVETALSRVQQRVRQGGHDVPEHVIRRRFASGLKNFEDVYKSLVDAWLFYDSSNDTPVLLQKGEQT